MSKIDETIIPITNTHSKFLEGKTVVYITGYGKSKEQYLGTFIRYVGDDKFEVDRGFTKTYIWKKDRLLGLFNDQGCKMGVWPEPTPEEIAEEERLNREADEQEEKEIRVHSKIYDYFYNQIPNDMVNYDTPNAKDSDIIKMEKWLDDKISDTYEKYNYDYDKLDKQFTIREVRRWY